MSRVEDWLRKRHELSEADLRVLDDLVARARFAYYCQTGSGQGSGGTCMAGFGALVVRHAPKFGVAAKELLQELLAEASEAASQGDWDI